MAEVPEGFILESHRDPWDILREEGWTATNGFRTDSDVARIRRQGYRPAAHGDHNRGDGVDLDHPRLSRGQQMRRLHQLFGGWPGRQILDEGHHRHLALPGWNAAPGTPGTPNSGLPPLPDGFEIEQRGSLRGDNFVTAAPESPAQPPEQSGPSLAAEMGAGLARGQADFMNRIIAESTIEASRPQAARGSVGTAQVMPDDPGGRFIATTRDPERLRRALTLVEFAFDQGEPRGEIIRIAQSEGVQITPQWIAALNEALAWREQNRGQLGRVNTFVPGEVAQIRQERTTPASPLPGPFQPSQELRAHHPDFAERTGQGAAGAYSAVTGADEAEAIRRVGRPTEGLLQFTGVGDLDAALEFDRRRQQALAEGRAVDAAGNQLGQQVAAAGLIPIVGPAISRVRRGASSGARRLGDLFRRRTEEPAEVLGDLMPGRQRDYIDVGQSPMDAPQMGRTRRISQSAPEPPPAVRPEDMRPARAISDANDAEQVIVERPATPYEELTARPSNINLAHLETVNDIQRALNNTNEAAGGMETARRGIQSHEETQALAQQIGMTADDLLTRRQGQALNSEQALAARQILARSLDEIVELARRVEGGSEEELAAFRRAWVRHVAIQEQVTGATAEAGRALQSFRIAARSTDHRRRILQAFIENGGGEQNMERLAQGVINAVRLNDIGQANRLLYDANKPTWKDRLVELWYNSLLSGPRTHAVNVLSNTMTAALQIPEHAAASALGAVRWRSFDRVMGSEVGARVTGMLQGMREGLRAFAHTFRTGDVPDFVQKVETARQEAIGGTLGHVLRTPTRLLSAEDEFFKATARRMELAGLAVRRARSEGLRGEDLARRIEQLNANPPNDMMERALEYGRYLTFQRDVGPIAKKVMGITRDAPYWKLVIPFVRTPTNLIKFAAERSPLAPMVRAWREDFKAGGARRDLAVARMMLGTGLGVLVGQWASSGMITGGGPADENAKRLLQADGWQPYSVRVGDTYYSYQRLDPLSTTIGVVADMVDLQSAMTERQQEQVAMLVVASVLENLSGKTWLSGLSDFLQIFEDPQRYGPQFINRTAGSVAVPALGAQTAQTLDPTMREARNILDSIRSRVPGLSDNLPPRRDVFGRPVVREGGVGPDIVSPIYTRERQNDPVVDEVARLNVRIGYPSRRVGGGALPPDVYDQYQELAGRYTYEGIGAAMADPEWSTLDTEMQRRELNQIKNGARRQAREELFGLD